MFGLRQRTTTRVQQDLEGGAQLLQPRIQGQAMHAKDLGDRRHAAMPAHEPAELHSPDHLICKDQHHVRQIGGTQLLVTGDVAGEVDGRAALLAQTDLEAGEADPLEADQPPRNTRNRSAHGC